MSRSFPAFALGLLVYAIDQATKWLALHHLEWGRPVVIIPSFFNLTLVHNTGAAWGILRNQSFLLTLLAAITLVVLCLMRRHFTYTHSSLRIALGLLLGGIAGNLTDRLLRGHVVDFLSFYLGRFQWPAFNIADSAICIGVGLYAIHSFRNPSHGAFTPPSSLREE